MPATADARAMPSVAVHWIKNNILAAIISAPASFGVYGVRYATGAADPDAGVGAMALLCATAAILWGLYGSAAGVLTGAVLQRVVPLLPTRTWIGLHASMAVVLGVGSELGLVLTSGVGKATDDASIGEMLVSGFIVGAVLGAAAGGLQALVLRRAALGVGAWTAWSTAAFAIAFSFFAGSTNLVDAGGGLAGELANQALAFLTEVIAAVVMVQALRRLRDPMLSRAGQYFS